MDDTVLKAFIQTQCKRIFQHENLIDNDNNLNDLLKFVYCHDETKQLLIKINKQISESWPLKESELAKRNRQDGNEAFQMRNYELALLLFTESMRYCPTDIYTYESEEFSLAVYNRSSTYFQLKKFENCLQDIELALNSGYPSSLAYKLIIRQCKCLLQLGRIGEAQKAFDRAVDAIDMSGLNKGLRKNLAVDLQSAFINLTKSMEEEGLESSLNENNNKIMNPLPKWTQLKETHPKYPSASSSVSVKFDSKYGRHVVATKDIEAGEVLFHENPIVCHLLQEDETANEACNYCFNFIGDEDFDIGVVPCPTCANVAFCSIKCRNLALKTYHRYECNLSGVFQATKLEKLPLVMMSVRALTQKSYSFFLENKEVFNVHNPLNGVDDENNEVFLSDDYRNLFHLVTHLDQRKPQDKATKACFAIFLLCCLKSVEYFDENTNEDDEIFIARLIYHFLSCFQFNTHMIECVYNNRLIAQDAETRIWKESNKFSPGEFVETVRLGGGIYPTLANVNHSCDPNVILLNWGNRAIAFANRPIKCGEQIFDTYGPVYYHLNREERINFLQGSHWFECNCVACSNNWNIFQKMPREYLKLPGAHFKHRRCNRKELQKEVEKLKRKVRQNVLDKTKTTNECMEQNRELFLQWMTILDELVYPPHQDYVNVRRGIRNCLWLQSPNVCKVKEDDTLREKRAIYLQKNRTKK